MDIVDTFNVLIPSDQLDDSLVIGQNLECEASNEFGSGLCLEDSLKNMLSDKDPMFGCATSQFNLLDNEDSTFQISGSAGMLTTSTYFHVVLSLSICGLWLKPSVVLKRLTVTIGGFKIELLPGPSYLHDTEANFDGSFSYGADVGFAMLSDDGVAAQNPALQKVADQNVTENLGVDDTPLGLGPYVNPNDVQAANGTETKKCTQETKDDNQPIVRKQKPVNDKKCGVKTPPSNGTAASNKVDNKEKKPILAKNLLQSKQPLTFNKKSGVIGEKSNATKGATVSQNVPSKVVQRDVLHKLKSLKEKRTDSLNSTHVTRLGHSSKTPEEAGQEKPKMKKPEKILQRQKSKTARSISVDEPQLFIPDNAPAVKKESVEPQQQEQPANSESVWDGNNCCGQCKKHHNNMFMVGCGRCDDWFHGDCVGLDLLKVREMEEEDQMYVCLKCCEEESKKLEPETSATPAPELKTEAVKQAPKPKSAASEELTSGGVRSFKKVSIQLKPEAKSKSASSSSKKPASVEEIRRSVRDSLKDILIQRLKESDLNVPVEKASEVAKKIEREIFHMYKDTENKYKNKYRSLMFNLKDTKNNVLFRKVLKGEISPANLIRMSPEELASKELAAWRQRENRHTIEMIEKEQREVERRPITKITHKGEIEIESEEPRKVSEPVEVEPPVKAPEVPVEAPIPPEKPAESTETQKDTTSKHKSHLFDLNCKICTGRMAPPVKEAPTKVVKVATTVAKRQSAKSEETSTPTPSAVEDDLHLTVLEESFQKAHTSYERRRALISGRDDDASFLSSLKSLWRGFLTMHSVAKLVTKVFPVSGILDSLTQDLPDSIMVGGRISPQTVWDYLEKIRATGTKEVCLIRFSPVTEEDEISYTLLYAYFSSRRRFGVVSNNRKQVKDMYLIPLGASEKVPHQLVPFDGPGLENNRANLLLGLIIRQRPKRDYIPVDVNERTRMSPDVKPVPASVKETPAEEDDEKLFLASLTTPNKSEKDKLLETTEAAEEPITESFEEPSAAANSSQESHKPLRFLPGVLLGWGGELPPLPDFGGQPFADTHKAQPALKTEVPPSGGSKGPAAAATAAAPRDRFVIKKKEVKVVQAEPQSSGQTEAANASLGKDAEPAPRGPQVSLRDKPPDVSTEAFLDSLATIHKDGEVSSSDTPKKEDIALPDSDKAKLESQPASENTNGSKPLSGILKKISNYSSVTENKAGETSPITPVDDKHAPVLGSSKISSVTTFHQGFLQISQAKHKLKEQNPSDSQSVPGDCSDPAGGHSSGTVTQAGNPSVVPQDTGRAPALPTCNSAAPAHHQQQHQPQVPGSDHDPPFPNSFHNLHIQDPNHSTPEAQEYASFEANPETLAQPTGQPPSQAKEEAQEELYTYCHPWEERQSHSEDRDHHHERHGHRRDSHHGKKSRHHDRGRSKKHEHGSDGKRRDKSRHHRHSEDHYGERRKERYYSDDYTSRHKERHRHRRDSDYDYDYDNVRRSSKDSYS
uniref:PHD finger protein 3 n=1 Tax=Hippocampus comes TaxID=109280 RepID=A0A3Q2YZ21_HIPCM